MAESCVFSLQVSERHWALHLLGNQQLQEETIMHLLLHLHNKHCRGPGQLSEPKRALQLVQRAPPLISTHCIFCK